MLYLSTRNKADSFTAYRVLHSDAAPDGGMFLPMQLPVQNDADLAAFAQMNFGEAAAAVLNLFFGTKLSGWDVDFAVGRQAVDLVSIGHKVYIAESWHNPAGTQTYLAQRLYDLVTNQKNSAQVPNLWFQTAVNIAVLFSAYGKCCRRRIYKLDIAVESGDLMLLLAVRYAKKMGLPIREIILGCTDQDSFWDFLSDGDYAVGRKDWNAGLEALLWLEFGYGEAACYLTALENKSIYRLKTYPLEQLRKGLFVTVVGESRVKNVAESSPAYRMEPGTARAFAAVQDYRAKTGENKDTLLFARNTPEKE